MTHAFDHKLFRISHFRAWAILFLIVVAFATHRLAWGDDLTGPPPMPPLPEDVRVDLAVQPAAFETATPLPLDGSQGTGNAAPSGRMNPKGQLGNWTVLAAIASAFVVLAAFRFQQTRRRSRELPGDVFEVLGEAPLGGHHAVRVVRFGPRTLLIGLSSGGCQTLATLDDPQATERIVNACLGGRTSRPSRTVARPPVAAGGQGTAVGKEA